MNAQSAFLDALAKGVAPERLSRALEAVAQRDGRAAEVTCLERWLTAAEEEGVELAELTTLRRRLAETAEAAAEEAGPEDGPRFALTALGLWSDVLADADGTTRAARLAMMLGSHDDGCLNEVADRLGGYAGAVEILAKAVKDKAIKADPSLHIAHRRALARVCELSGDLDRAFLETLRLVRKAPSETLYVDEAFRLALATDHAQELVAVFEELVVDEGLAHRQRATLYNKIGHLKERGLDNPGGAYAAYVDSLRFHPKSKGARRHAERLASTLGEAFEMPEPEPEPEPAPPPEPAPTATPASEPKPATVAHDVELAPDIEGGTEEIPAFNGALPDGATLKGEPAPPMVTGTVEGPPLDDKTALLSGLPPSSVAEAEDPPPPVGGADGDLPPLGDLPDRSSPAVERTTVDPSPAPVSGIFKATPTEDAGAALHDDDGDAPDGDDDVPRDDDEHPEDALGPSPGDTGHDDKEGAATEGEEATEADEGSRGEVPPAISGLMPQVGATAEGEPADETPAPESELEERHPRIAGAPPIPTAHDEPSLTPSWRPPPDIDSEADPAPAAVEVSAFSQPENADEEQAEEQNEEPNEEQDERPDEGHVDVGAEVHAAAEVEVTPHAQPAPAPTKVGGLSIEDPTEDASTIGLTGARRLPIGPIEKKGSGADDEGSARVLADASSDTTDPKDLREDASTGSAQGSTETQTASAVADEPALPPEMDLDDVRPKLTPPPVPESTAFNALPPEGPPTEDGPPAVTLDAASAVVGEMTDIRPIAAPELTEPSSPPADDSIVPTGERPSREEEPPVPDVARSTAVDIDGGRTKTNSQPDDPTATASQQAPPPGVEPEVTGIGPGPDEPADLPTVEAQVAMEAYAQAMEEQVAPHDRPTRIGGPPLMEQPAGASANADASLEANTLDRAPPLERTFAPFDEPSLPPGELELSDSVPRAALDDKPEAASLDTLKGDDGALDPFDPRTADDEQMVHSVASAPEQADDVEPDDVEPLVIAEASDEGPPASSGGAQPSSSPRDQGQGEDSSEEDSSEEDSSEEDSSEEDSSEEDSSKEDSSKEDSSEEDSSEEDSGEKASAAKEDAPGEGSESTDEVTVEEALALSDLEVLLEVGRRRTLKAAERLRVVVAAITRGDADGAVDGRAIELMLDLAAAAPEEALTSAQALKGELSEAGRKKLARFWLAVAAAVQDEDAVALLDDLALLDAPGGPLFRALDERYAAAHQLDPRLALRAAVLKQPLPDEVKRELLDNMISLLESHDRHADALPHYADLALADAHTSTSRRRRARAAYKRWSGRPDRQWFLGRLARIAEGDEASDILRELVPLRLEAADNLGAEAAARELLGHDENDPLALDTLIDLLEGDERRRDERIALLQRRLEHASDDAHSVRARVTHALAAAHLEDGAQPAAIEVLRQHLLDSPEDDLALSRVVMLLEELGREPDVEEVLEEVADRTQDSVQRRRLLLDAAERARARGRTARAGELCDRALDADPEAIDALLMRADLAVDHGDPEAALGPLERLASQTPEGPERARVHLRIGHLLEEHLLRPDDALKRYEAATAGDPSSGEAWEALRSLARQRKDRDRHVAALRGLANTHDDPQAQADLLKEAAAVERDERADLDAAEALFAEVLALTPSDEEALGDLLTLLAKRVQDADDLDQALAAPTGAFLREARTALAPVMQAAQGGEPVIALDIARLWARALEDDVKGEDDDGPAARRATKAWEAVLERASSDRVALTRLASLLERRTRGRRDDDAHALDARRKKLLETLLLHHAPDLDVPDRVSLWADLGALRWEAGESDSGRSALTKAFELADTPALRERLLARPATAAAAAWDGSLDDEDRRRLVQALLRLADLSEGEAAVESLLRACDVADDRLKDVALARKILKDGIAQVDDPTALYERLLDLDLHEGDPEAILHSTKALLEQELDPTREAELHVRLGKLLTKVKGDKEGAGASYRRAIELDPTNAQAIAGAEALFEENDDSEGLAELYSAQLKLIDRDDDVARIALLERLAQVRRYDLRDFTGAIEALEAMCSLDPDAVKPREDAARLYAQLGDWRGAVQAWRSVLERDPLHAEAWRGLLSVYALSEQGDEAFAVAAAMVSAEVADMDLTRAVRRARPPFPRWPKPAGTRDVVRLKVAHELERAPVRAVLDLCGRQVHPRVAQPLKEFGFSRKDRLPEKRLPQSVVLALRTITELLDLPGLPDLYLVEKQGDAAMPPFALLPAQEAGLIVQAEVLSGGMTPERAFALGRAMAWLTPHGLIAGTLSPAEVKGLLEALVLLLLPSAEMEGDERELEPLARDLETHLFGRRGKTEPLRTRLTSAVRDYVHARGQLSVADWVAGVGYTGDRLGFLLAGDLAPSVRGIKSSADASQTLGARLAIKELLLFSISPAYLTLRRELGLALSDGETSAILELV